jgi:hypothetical protein
LEAEEEETMNYVILEKSEKYQANKLLEFLEKNPYPKDKEIHALAEKLGVEHSKFEGMIYGIISNLIEHGKNGKHNPKELKLGIDVESEHTNYPALAKFIAMAHLKEMPDYYTRLKKMEREAKK